MPAQTVAPTAMATTARAAHTGIGRAGTRCATHAAAPRRTTSTTAATTGCQAPASDSTAQAAATMTSQAAEPMTTRAISHPANASPRSSGRSEGSGVYG